MTNEEVKRDVINLMKSLNGLNMKDIIQNRDDLMNSLDELKLLLIDFDKIIKPSKRKDMYINIGGKK